jgi:hypothetical protein
MARAVLENLFRPERLDALFERTARNQHHRPLLFAAVVELMPAVVLGVEPTVDAADRRRRPALPVSDQAVDDKLDGRELGLSAALVRDAAGPAEATITALAARRPAWRPGYRVRVRDGNPLSATGHRAAERRTTWAAPVPGQVRAVREVVTERVPCRVPVRVPYRVTVCVPVPCDDP